MQDLHVVQLNVNLTLSYNFEEILSRVTMIQIGVLASLVCSHTKVMKVNEDSDTRLFLRESYSTATLYLHNYRPKALRDGSIGNRKSY